LNKLYDAVAKIDLSPIDPDQPDGIKKLHRISIIAIHVLINRSRIKMLTDFLGKLKAVGIWSKDGEYVSLKDPVHCYGQVCWL